MTKKYAGTEIETRTQIKDADGNLVDPTTVTFKYRVGPYKQETVATVKISTGVYSATFTPTIVGNLFGTWAATGDPVITKPVWIPIAPNYPGEQEYRS